MKKLMIFTRRFASLLVFIVFFFGANSIGGTIYAKLNVLQVGPLFLRSLVEGSLVVLSFFTVMVLSTFIFGRWYCSFLCPLGAFQDVVMGIRNKIKPYKFKFASVGKFRYITFILIFVPLFLGIILPLAMLDPFSIFTRFTAAVFFPLVTAIQTHVWNTVSLNMFIAALEIVLITIFAAYRGRFFCNSFCPVGALLGEAGRNPLLAIKINDNCVHCGACEKICKAEAIRHKDKYIDNSKCVMCFNCLGQCKFKAISYAKTNGENQNKRKFILGLLAFGAGAVLSNRLVFNKRTFVKETLPSPLPPGARSIERLRSKCIGCNACAQTCPVKIIKIHGTPSLDFTNNFCQFDCFECSKVCPSKAIEEINLDTKKKTKIGEAGLDLDICIIRTKHEACGACAEHCPTGALTMRPNTEGIPEPVLNKELCIGCGACTYICPVRPVRAVNVHGLAYPTIALQLEKRSDNIIDDNTEGFAF